MGRALVKVVPAAHGCRSGVRRLVPSAAADLARVGELLARGRPAAYDVDPADVARMRAQGNAMLRQAIVRQPVAGVSVLQGRLGAVRGEWLGRSPCADDRVVLFLHGGGYVRGHLALGRIVASGLAAAAGVPVFDAGYRQAPEHRFPAAFDDAVAACEALLARGIEARRIVVVGESAGGAMAISLAMWMRDRGRPLPAAIAALSPVVDMTMPGASWTTNAARDLVTREIGLRMLALYIDEADRRDVRASPASGRLDGLPPLSLHVGGNERMLDDTVAFARAAAACVTAVELWTYDGMPHGFTKFDLDATAAAIDAVARRVIGLCPASPG